MGKINQIKEKIEKLIQKYEAVKKAGKAKSYTEEETKKDFILPLFEALGWDVFDKNEVSAEEKNLSSGRVDYGFYINERAKFYLEAKKLSADLNSEQFANQAVRYSWNKGVTWAILTDFESLKVFNAQDIESSLANKLFFEITHDKYLDRSGQLALLSKESFAQDLLDKEGEKYGKKLQKISVSALLYKDLQKCREILTHDLSIWNKKLDKDLLDEGVQKLLDRLIFLRVAEDRGIENPTLIPMIRAWEAGGQKTHLYQVMAKKFRELDDIYNSNLFSPHPFENWEEYGGATEKVFEILYGKKGYYEYDFKAMPADVLGTVYENYLGYKTAQSQKDSSVSKDTKKRKEQGIYYTPSFIVDYIVKNALGPVLDKCISISDLKKIKVLDPACGSGSFLVRAVELINDKYKEFGAKGDEMTKIQILKENIYGVDLDEQAVEIARLNLLITALDSRMELPPLTDNIKNGNSLISGTDRELEKYFGKNYLDKKPFSWEEEFPEVFDRENPGFDVVIGNPPWVFTRGENFSETEKKYFDQYLIKLRILPLGKGKNIQSGKLNLYSLFVIKGLELLKNGGYLGFIIPNNILRTTTFDIVRKYFLDSTRIKSIVDLGEGIFKSVTASSVILFLEKESGEHLRISNSIEVVTDVEDLQASKFEGHAVKQQAFYNNESYAFNILADDKSLALNRKIEQDTEKLGFLAKYIMEGIVGSTDRDVSDTKINDSYKPFLVGKDIGRYRIDYKNKWIRYDKQRLHRARPEEVFLSEKILLQRISGGDSPLVATLDRDKYYTFASINNILLKDNSFNPTYVLGLINSRLINWYYSTNFSNRSKLTVNVSKTFLSQIPIKKESKTNQGIIIGLVKKMLNLTEDLQKFTKDSNKYNLLKSEIE
ncbi:MAG: hypothetical protein A2Z11_03520 [Candidatus Woykebacteria bacterium RBG_16_43_9]|uniref:site-specific DNA-methyltransferase (adenine-specific) n=1 Tax=Candidatus Woykebacteria bacterium RBG_16_43_9 TaxID=1802596 RepID=A0A1G1WCW2_9BACT|nr:MAG: hypothetical protein A2Z11_03520 [Candidatus Woykebacteria bacterium RBG_16_43_9]